MSQMEQQERIVIQGRVEGLSWRQMRDQIKDDLGKTLTIDGLRGTARRMGWTKKADDLMAGQRHVQKKFDLSKGQVTVKSLDIRTVEDALDYADVDTDVWQVVSHEITFWPTTVGAKNSGTGKPESLTNYRVFVRLARIKEPDAEHQAMIDLIESLKTKKVKTKSKGKQHEEEVVLFMGLFDHHFGKLAWHAESGTDYDLPIAKKAFIGAVEDLLDRAQGHKISKIVFPLGNDFFQIDGIIGGVGATTKGTLMDTDGRLAKILRIGMEAFVETVEMCAAVAPIEVIYVPGNHDWNISFYLATIIEARFWDDDRVSVDVSPNPRKYKRYGRVLIGLTHGNEEKQADLPAIMAGEAKEDWAKADDYMWFIGHVHRRRETRYSAGDTFGAVQIRVLPSLSGTDAWHHKKGYVKTDRAAEAYLFHPEEGYIGHISVKIRPELVGEV